MLEMPSVANIPIPDSIAFNKGCDARLAGVPYKDCPYVGASEGNARLAWQRGWRDMSRSWPGPLPPAKR